MAIQLTIDGFEVCIVGDPHRPDPLRRVAWAGYAQKRGASMTVSEEEKAEALAIIGAASANAAALDTIAHLLQRDWSHDTIAAIAAAVRLTGREVPE